MPKFEVVVTRDCTESIVIDVTAENEDDAREVALAQTKAKPFEAWERDDCSSSKPYTTGCEEAE